MGLYEQLNQKYMDVLSESDTLINEALTRQLKLINKDMLSKYVELGEFIVIQFCDDNIIYYNNKRQKKYWLTINKNYTIIYDNNDLTYDINKLEVSDHYLYKLWKDNVKPVDNIHPKFDDEKLKIWYEWKSPKN